MAGYLTNRISALVTELLETYDESDSSSSRRHEDVLKFALEQLDRMPWLPRYAIEFMTLLFGLSSFFHIGSPFTGSLSQQLRKKQLDAWSRSSFRPCRDCVKFYTAMVVLPLYSDPQATDHEGL